MKPPPSSQSKVLKQGSIQNTLQKLKELSQQKEAEFEEKKKKE